jgi:hypothetical protein
MSLIRIHADPSPRQLAVFGVAWLAFFMAAGIGAVGRGAPEMATGLGLAAVLIPAMGLISTRLIRGVYLGMAYATWPIGLVMSFLLLAAVYYLVLSPTGLLMRAFGYDPLRRSKRTGAESYWVPRESGQAPDRYFRQY